MEIQFPQSPIVGDDGLLANEWIDWLQNPQILSLIIAAALGVGYGGTGLTEGTSGGVLAFTASDTIASSTALGSSRLVLGGGAGAAPSTPLGLGLAHQTLHANPAGAPTWSAVDLTTDVTGTLPAANGGTGISSYTVGDMLYASGATTLSKLADVATGNVLRSGGVAAAPAYGKVNLTTDVTGTLPAANGGTGIASYTAGDLIYASASTTLAKLADVATGNVLRAGGVGVAPAYGKVALTTDVSGTLPFGNGGTGLTSVGSAGQIIRSTGAAFALSAATYPDTVTSGRVLLATGSNVLGNGPAPIADGTYNFDGAVVGTVSSITYTSGIPTTITVR